MKFQFLPLILAIGLLSCIKEKYLPVYGENCFELEEGQKKLILSDTLLTEYENFVFKESGFENSSILLNRIFEGEDLTTIVCVAIDAKNDKVQEFWERTNADYILDKRVDSTGYHYTYKTDRLYYFMIRRNDQPSTTLFWEYSSDSTLLNKHYTNTTYYSNKFECKE